MDLPVTDEIVFDVMCGDLGGYAADCPTEDISVMADTWEELRGEVKAAVERHFQNAPKPVSIRLHLVRDDVISLEPAS
jgi:hypothetical protein